MDTTPVIEITSYLAKIGPPILILLFILLAMNRFPGWLLKRMESDAVASDKLMVQLNRQITTLTSELTKLKSELEDYKNNFSKLLEEHAKLRIEYESLKGLTGRSQNQKRTGTKK